MRFFKTRMTIGIVLSCLLRVMFIMAFINGNPPHMMIFSVLSGLAFIITFTVDIYWDTMHQKGSLFVHVE